MRPVRGAIVGLLGFMLTACAAAAEPSALHPALTLEGKIEQGSVIRGTAAPGAKVSLDGMPIMVDSKGQFVFGFDRDATGDDELSVTWPGGDTETRKLTIVSRDWADSARQWFTAKEGDATRIGIP